jgi:hypothetical protein
VGENGSQRSALSLNGGVADCTINRGKVISLCYAVASAGRRVTNGPPRRIRLWRGCGVTRGWPAKPVPRRRLEGGGWRTQGKTKGAGFFSRQRFSGESNLRMFKPKRIAQERVAQSRRFDAGNKVEARAPGRGED